MRRILAMGFRFLCAGGATAGGLMLCLLLGAAALAAAEGRAQLVVVNAKTNTKGSEAGSVVFLAPDTYEALGTVDVGPDPTFAALSPDDRFLYLVHGGGDAHRGSEQGALSVLDTEAQAARVVARAMQRYGMLLADGGRVALTAQSDRFTRAKWAGLLGSRDLQALQPRDFEMVEAGERIPLTNDCVRNP